MRELADDLPRSRPEYRGWDVSRRRIAGTTKRVNAEGIVQEGDILLAITTLDGTRHDKTRLHALHYHANRSFRGAPMIERDGVTQISSPSIVAVFCTVEPGLSEAGIYLTVDPPCPYLLPT